MKLRIFGVRFVALLLGFVLGLFVQSLWSAREPVARAVNDLFLYYQD